MEKRQIDFRAEKSGENIEGYVVRYNSPSDIGGMIEQFAPGSIEIDPNARMLFNHNEDQLLGRAGANLEFEDRDDGLFYRLRLPSTTLGDDVRELVRDRIIQGASLGFIAGAEHDESGIRTIDKALLSELSLVSAPAHKSASADLRALKNRARKYHWGELIV